MTKRKRTAEEQGILGAVARSEGREWTEKNPPLKISSSGVRLGLLILGRLAL
jgi:hypothetical protein